MPSHGLLDADRILPGLRQHLAIRLEDRLAPVPEPPRTTIPLTVNRTPFFCSGCPHNWGTKVPEGSTVGAGIARSPNEALVLASSIGFPVALKVHSPDISHKSDAGGVRLNINSAQVKERMNPVADGAPILWNYVSSLIDDGIKKGYLAE